MGIFRSAHKFIELLKKMKKLNVLPFQKVTNRYLRMTLIIIEFAVIAYVLICIAIYFLQDKLIFLPKFEIIQTPKDYGIEFKNIYFSSGEDKLHGYYIPHKTIKKDANEGKLNPNDYTILYCHGNAGNVSHRENTIKMYHNLGFNIFLFDYSGYGESSGKPSAENLELNVVNAWNFLTKQKGIPEKKIIIIGRSLGGFVALSAGEKFNPFALSLESTFSSIKNIAQHQMPLVPAKLILKNDFDNMAKIKNVKVPIFMVHSKDDKIVKYYHSQKLLKAAKENDVIKQITFRSFTGGHNGCYFQDENNYTTKFLAFLDDVYKNH